MSKRLAGYLLLGRAGVFLRGWRLRRAVQSHRIDLHRGHKFKLALNDAHHGDRFAGVVLLIKLDWPGNAFKSDLVQGLGDIIGLE